MRVHGLIVVPERPPQREHTVRRVDEVLAAQHVRDAHVDVVDRVGEEEHRRAVRPHDHEVGDRRPLDRDLAADDVGERAASFVGGAEANRAEPALGDVRGALLGGEIAATAVVARRAAFLHRLLVALPHLGFGAEALVRVAGVDQPLRGREVAVETRALEMRALVPLETEPAQDLLDLLDRLLRRRATSVSSIRRMNVPPTWRACNQLNSAVARRCRCGGMPVGAGENRNRAWVPAVQLTAGGDPSRSRPAGSGSCPRRSG